MDFIPVQMRRWVTNHTAAEAAAPRRARLVLTLVGVFVLAFAIRLGLTVAFVGLGSPPEIGANSDQYDYELFAWQLAQGHGYGFSADRPSATRLPGTSWTILPVYLAFGRDFALARLWLIAISAATCSLVALAAWRMFGPLCGVAAGLLLAGAPEHAYYAMHFLSETPAGLWLIVMILASYEALQRRDWRWDVLAGIACTASIYCRPQAAFVLPAAWMIWLLAGRTAWRLHWPRVVLPSVLVVVLLLPWMVRNHVVMDRFGLSTIVGTSLWGAHNPVTFGDSYFTGGWIPASSLQEQFPLPQDEVQRDRQALHYTAQTVRENFGRLPWLEVMKLRTFLEPERPWNAQNKIVALAFAASWCVFGPLTVVGLIVAWRRNPRAASVFLALALGTIGMVLLFYGLKRFRHAMAPAYVPMAALAGVQLLRHAAIHSRLRLLASLGNPPQPHPAPTG